MRIETINLFEKYPMLAGGEHQATLKAYVHTDCGPVEESYRFPAMLICPGGGYVKLSIREQEPIALAFYSRGFNCYVLDYSRLPEGYPKQLLQAMASVHLIRTNPEWNNSDKLSVIGFSAGGHLAGTVGSRYHESWIAETLGCDPALLRIDATVLGYPVTICEDDSHWRSMQHYLGDAEASMEECKKHDLRALISDKTAPCFIWHTAEDEAVPVEDSLRYAIALRRGNVPVEVHVFPFGYHALSVADETTAGRPQSLSPYVHRWVDMAKEWLTLILNR